MSSAVLRYSLLRLGLLVVVLVVLRLVGFGGWLLILLAAVVSMALSYVLLAAPRAQLSRQIAARAERPAARRRPSRFDRHLDDDAAVEDAAVEQTDRVADDARAQGEDEVRDPRRP